MQLPAITAVVPLHNQAALLTKLLESTKRQSLPFAEIIVVDNASTDEAPDVARSMGCTVISLTKNTGFAHAVNVGWRTAKTEWIAILNSDVELDREWLRRLVDAIGPDGFATGTILRSDDRNALDGTYDLLSRSGCAWRAGCGQQANSVPAETRAIRITPATACLFRRDVLERLGGFDESYGSYLEDVDFGLRCIGAGISGVFVSKAIAVHKGSATLGRWNPQVVRLISRNQLLLVGRHYDRALFRSCFWHVVVGQVLWGLVAARHGAALAWFSGKINALNEFELQGLPNPRLRVFLDESEHEIRIRATDPYWRWYFRLTAGAAH